MTTITLMTDGSSSTDGMALQLHLQHGDYHYTNDKKQKYHEWLPLHLWQKVIVPINTDKCISSMPHSMQPLQQRTTAILTYR